MELSVSEKYKEVFKVFSTYFEKEKIEIGDDSLDKELKVLKTLEEHETKKQEEHADPV